MAAPSLPCDHRPFRFGGVRYSRKHATHCSEAAALISFGEFSRIKMGATKKPIHREIPVETFFSIQGFHFGSGRKI